MLYCDCRSGSVDIMNIRGDKITEFMLGSEYKRNGVRGTFNTSMCILQMLVCGRTEL